MTLTVYFALQSAAVSYSAIFNLAGRTDPKKKNVQMGLYPFIKLKSIKKLVYIET